MALKKRFLALCMAVVMVFSLCSISAFAAAPTDDKQPVVIGRYDAPLSECLEPGMAMQVGIANVRVNSYATYDKNDGVQVHVELYVPWYSSPKPEFTGMTGNVKLTMQPQKKSLQRVWEWLEKSVAPSLKLFSEIGKLEQRDYIGNLIANGEMNITQRQLYDDYVKSSWLGEEERRPFDGEYQTEENSNDSE